jgi:flagellar motor component MotA
MLVIIGSLAVVVCVVGGFVMMGGHIETLIQPVKFIIVVGASIGAFLIANPMPAAAPSSQPDCRKTAFQRLSARQPPTP